MKRNHKGFSTPIIILLVVMIIGISGATGYFVYSHTKTGKAGDTQQPQANAADKSEEKDRFTTMNFSEIGATINIPMNSTVYYEASPDNSNVVGIKTHLLDDEQMCKDDPISIVALIKVPKDGTDEVSGRPYAELLKDSGKFIGDYIYYVRGGGYACAKDPEKQKIADQLRIDTVKSLQTLQVN